MIKQFSVKDFDRNTYPYTAHEIEKLNRGNFVVPLSYRRLREQVKWAFRNVLLVISSVAEKSEEYSWIVVPGDADSIRSRLRMSKSFLAADLEELETLPGSPADSYGMAINLLIDRAQKVVAGDETLKLESRSELSEHVVSSMISLLVVGQVKEALHLAQLSDGLSIVEDAKFLSGTDHFPGYNQKLSPYFRQIKILRLLSAYLQRREIPRRTLLKESPSKDKGNFSRDLAALRLRDYLPPGTWAANRFSDGDVYRLDFPDESKGPDEIHRGLVQKLKRAHKDRWLDLTDNQWALLEHLLGEQNNDQTQDHRSVLNGILWILRIGAEWVDLPGRYGSYSVVHRRFLEWEQRGIVRTVLKALADDLRDRGGIDLRQWFVDPTFPSLRRGALAIEELAWTDESPWRWSTALIYMSPVGRTFLNPMPPTSDENPRSAPYNEGGH